MLFPNLVLGKSRLKMVELPKGVQGGGKKKREQELITKDGVDKSDFLFI